MGFSDNRIAVRYCYESQSTTGRWYRSYGNENWEFESNGLMSVRHSSINDVEISASERQFHWELGRSEEHTSELQSRFDLVCRLLLAKKNHASAAADPPASAART